MSSALHSAFTAAKVALTEEIQRSTVSGEWTRTQKLAQYAGELDKMITGLGINGQNGFDRTSTFSRTELGHSKALAISSQNGKAPPYHFVSGNSLSKIGPSRDGSSYQHNVVRAHYEEIVSHLIVLSKSRKEFETHELSSRCNVPAHEPLIVLAVFEQAGLLTKYRRGRYAFVDGASFEQRAMAVWDKLPRN